ncbi:VanZ family protein [Paenibacillus sp. sgz302251]|uniref:VanZ family protein n=1 Tax=Paenibacillus sp. sgz302251 TaxID=3414493 RepID=UPI003C7A9486
MKRIKTKNAKKWLPSLGWGSLLAAWITLVFIFSSQTYEQQSIRPLLENRFNYQQLVQWLPNVTIRYGDSVVNSHNRPYSFIEFLFRKGAHLFIYAVFAAIFFMFIRSLNPRRLFRAIGATLVVVLAVSALDEWNQLGSAHRTGSITDIWLDFTGGSIGVLFCLALLGLIKLHRKRKLPAPH